MTTTTLLRCHTCQRPMRPKGTLASDYPGTVRRENPDTCGTCAARARRGTSTSSAPLRVTSTSPADHAHNVAALQAYLAGRHRRLGAVA